MPYLLLAVAIVLEIAGLTALKETNGFTRLVPSALFAVALASSFYLESLTLQFLPIGLTYATWSGLGIVGMTLVGAIVYGDRVNSGVVVGVLLIVAGVAVLNHWTALSADEDPEETAETDQRREIHDQDGKTAQPNQEGLAGLGEREFESGADDFDELFVASVWVASVPAGQDGAYRVPATGRPLIRVRSQPGDRT